MRQENVLYAFIFVGVEVSLIPLASCCGGNVISLVSIVVVEMLSVWDVVREGVGI